MIKKKKHRCFREVAIPEMLALQTMQTTIPKTPALQRWEAKCRDHGKALQGATDGAAWLCVQTGALGDSVSLQRRIRSQHRDGGENTLGGHAAQPEIHVFSEYY